MYESSLCVKDFICSFDILTFFFCFVLLWPITHTQREKFISSFIYSLTYLHNLEMNLIWFNWCCLNHEQLIFCFPTSLPSGNSKNFAPWPQRIGVIDLGYGNMKSFFLCGWKWSQKTERSKYRREEERPREAIRWCPFIKFYSEVM